MVLPGGHTGPPLRRLGSWVEIDQHITSLFSSVYLKMSSKFYV